MFWFVVVGTLPEIAESSSKLTIPVRTLNIYISRDDNNLFDVMVDFPWPFWLKQLGASAAPTSDQPPQVLASNGVNGRVAE